MPDHCWDFALEVVDLVGVLSLGELAVEKRHIVIGFVLQDLHPLAPARLVLRGLRHREQLGHLQNTRRSLVYSIEVSITTNHSSPGTPPPSSAALHGIPL